MYLHHELEESPDSPHSYCPSVPKMLNVTQMSSAPLTDVVTLLVYVPLSLRYVLSPTHSPIIQRNHVYLTSGMPHQRRPHLWLRRKDLHERMHRCKQEGRHGPPRSLHELGPNCDSLPNVILLFDMCGEEGSGSLSCCHQHGADKLMTNVVACNG